MGRYAEYENPPVVEAVLGIQFGPLPLSIAHYGWFWKNYLGAGWTSVATAPRLDDTFERFGEERTWHRSELRLEQTVDASRFRQQIMKSDSERMIQLQDTRFIYNWRKRDGRYPSYDKLRPEFDDHFSTFQRFLVDADIGPMNPNQWEVVYVNYIPRGELWESPNDWPKILPNFYVPGAGELDAFVGMWSTVLDDHAGRLHIDLKHVQLVEPAREIMRLQLTARGPLESLDELSGKFELGHRSIVTTFTAMTSELAHQHWRRRS